MINQYQTKEQIGRFLYKQLIQEKSKDTDNIYTLDFTEDDYDTIDCVMTSTIPNKESVKSDVEIKVREVRKDYDWNQITTTILEKSKYESLIHHSDAKHKLYVVFYPKYNKCLIYHLDKYKELPEPILRSCNASTCANQVHKIAKLVYMLPTDLPKKYLSIVDFDCNKALEDYSEFIS